MSILSDEVTKRIQQIDALINSLENRRIQMAEGSVRSKGCNLPERGNPPEGSNLPERGNQPEGSNLPENNKLSKGSDMSEGRIRVSTNKGKHRYYLITDGGNPGGMYLKRSEAELAQRLIQTEYENRVLKSLYAERSVLLKVQEIYGSEIGHFFYGPEERIWQRLNEGRKRLAVPVVKDDEKFIKEWLSEDFERKPFAEDAPEFYTGSGIRVRSKTELIIAEMLEKKEIPFYYEKPLKLDRFGSIHPDFTVLNIKKRKTMYWEHLGMMDDADYRNHALERIRRYESAGFVPGIDLIITMESSYKPVRTRTIAEIIKVLLL